MDFFLIYSLIKKINVLLCTVLFQKQKNLLLLMTEFFTICSQIQVAHVLEHFLLYTPKPHHQCCGFEFLCGQIAFDPALKVDCLGTHGR